MRQDKRPKGKRSAIALLLSMVLAMAMGLVALPQRAYAADSDAVMVADFEAWEEFSGDYFRLRFKFVTDRTWAKYQIQVRELETNDLVATASDEVYFGSEATRYVNIGVDTKYWNPGKYVVFAKTYYWSSYTDSYLSSDSNTNYPNGYVSALFTYKMDLGGKALTLSNNTLRYNRKAQHPKVIAVDGVRLKEGVDYTVNYSNVSSRGIGTYTMTVTGKGNCYGTSAKATYKIIRATNPISAKAKPATVKAGKTIKAKKVFVVKKAVGKVSYEKATGNAKIIVAKNGNIKVKKGLKPGTYPIKVKVTAAGNATTAPRTVKVKVKVTVK